MKLLALDDPKWATLRQAYGSAANVPEILRELARRPVPAAFRDPRKGREEPDPWDETWSSLCHQGSRYTATYAAAPHIVEIAAAVPPDRRLTFCIGNEGDAICPSCGVDFRVASPPGET